jgi:hypothetical protein
MLDLFIGIRGWVLVTLDPFLILICKYIVNTIIHYSNMSITFG